MLTSLDLAADISVIRVKLASLATLACLSMLGIWFTRSDILLCLGILRVKVSSVDEAMFN